MQKDCIACNVGNSSINHTLQSVGLDVGMLVHFGRFFAQQYAICNPQACYVRRTSAFQRRDFFLTRAKTGEAFSQRLAIRRERDNIKDIYSNM
jgi:hypothetical protein